MISLNELTQIIAASLESDTFWAAYFRDVVFSQPPSVSVHLAVLVEPYLTFVLEGKKTIESRFSLKQIPPYGVVREGDVVLLKQVAGPVLGVCRVTHQWEYELDPTTLAEIRDKFSVALCAYDPEFWAMRSEAAYASLMKIDQVNRTIRVDVDKSDRRGWVVLRRRTRQLTLWDV